MDSKLVMATKQKDALTANGDITNSTSLNSLVDLFFLMGASRSMSEEDIHKLLLKAWVTDKKLTVKLIFHSGNIRGGKGERRFFRIAIEWLYKKDKKMFFKVFDLVPEFNRWDSLFHIQTKEVFDLVKENMSNGLLAKWLPRRGQYNNFRVKFCAYAGFTASEYRKKIVSASKTVESLMCQKKWADIKYDQIPSVAFNKYRKAWYRNDESRFKAFVELAKKAVTKGVKLIKADAIFPYDIYRSYRRGADHNSIDAQWMSLPDFMKDSPERILPVCDVSGSMDSPNQVPMSISVSLGVYLSERNKSIFKDAFVTFSSRPTMQYLKGSVTERFQQLERAHWEMNTDLDAVFNLILSKANSANLTQDDMPSMVLIISDMEFDSGYVNITAYDRIKSYYNQSGYQMPKLVFWNVNGRPGNVPISSKCPNAALVSGADPSTMVAILGGADKFTPESIMLKAINHEMYNVIDERLI